MAKDWAKSFYNSKQWRKCRNAYYKLRHGVCEQCEDVGKIVHHKTYITPNNINNPTITLAFGNLELLCDMCHKQEHGGESVTVEGVAFNKCGDLVQV